jgi:hypothetical protein
MAWIFVLVVVPIIIAWRAAAAERAASTMLK